MSVSRMNTSCSSKLNKLFKKHKSGCKNPKNYNPIWMSRKKNYYKETLQNSSICLRWNEWKVEEKNEKCMEWTAETI